NDLLRVRLRERSAQHGEVLGEDEDGAAVDRTVACDDAVAGDLLAIHAEVAAAMGDQLVEFLEGALVEQQVDAFARGELPLLVLACAPFPSAAFDGRLLPAAHLFPAVHSTLG